MDRSELATWWEEANTDGVWWAPWAATVEGLTAEEAAWKPGPGRHSIWQLINHMTFWREYFAHRAEGGSPLTEQELDQRNWPEPTAITEDGWRATCQRFAASHARIHALMADPATPPPARPQLDLRYLLLHDSYHVGQVMLLRALLGREALES